MVEIVSEGHSNPEIAGKLFIEVATVKTHLVHVYEKLGLLARRTGSRGRPPGDGMVTPCTPAPTLICAGRVWDGVVPSPTERGFVAAEDGFITAVGCQVELGSRLDWHNRVDLPAATVLPGLINGHVGDDTQFQLEESEVRLALSLGEHEEFIVVFVTNVFDSAPTPVHPRAQSLRTWRPPALPGGRQSPTTAVRTASDCWRRCRGGGQSRRPTAESRIAMPRLGTPSSAEPSTPNSA